MPSRNNLTYGLAVRISKEELPRIAKGLLGWGVGEETGVFSPGDALCTFINRRHNSYSCAEEE